MSDNTTPHMAAVYDKQVEQVIPEYRSFHSQIIDFISAYIASPGVWLDTGCGTGTLVAKALESFTSTSFILSDPSADMLEIAREKLSGFSSRVKLLDPAGSENLALPGESADVITAVMSHHYYHAEGRYKATENCFRMLKRDGVLISFENIRADSEIGTWIGLERWKRFQTERGKSEVEAIKHLERFNTEFFPISVRDHLKLLADTGFRFCDILWASYMQAGFYAIK